MSVEKPSRYVIFGAGAIGSAVAVLLARARASVTCVARPDYAEALRRGVTVKQDGEEISARTDAVTSAGELSPARGDCLFITTKSQATEAAVEELAAVYPSDTPVVCLQNGVHNEEIAARRFQNVYAGLVFMSAVQLQPSLITMPRGRKMAVGCYPKGVDDLSRQISDDLSRAGFEAMASEYVMAMKWSKFIVNLNNATFAIADYWVEQAMNDEGMRRLMLDVREEGLGVLEAAGVEIEPPASAPSPIRITELNEKLREPLRDSGAAQLAEDRRTYASMWQDLQLGRRSSEAAFLNGVIVELGKRVGIPTPYNTTLLEIIDRMFNEGLKPGIYTPAELRALIEEKAKREKEEEAKGRD
jgi:2-dehydropantoate 2-reductase